MKRNRLYIIYIIGVLLCCVACTTRQEEELATNGVVEIPFSLSMPTSLDFAPQRAPGIRREPGDPGMTEQFKLPRYAYIFIMQKSGTDWNMVDVITETLNDNDWQKERYSGPFMSEGDSIYRYTRKIRMLLSEDDVEGRMCAIASYEPLTFNVSEVNAATLPDWNALMNLKIDISSNTIQQSLHNIYSSPYNYILPSTGKYYGSFDNIGKKVASLDLMLYHIAAKIDLKWSVAENKRINMEDPTQAVRLTYLEARNMLNTSCYAFRPMENVVSALPATGYSIPNIVTPADEGLWWEGRTYFYTIPFTVSGEPGYFPVQLLMRTNGSNGTGYELTLNQAIDTSKPFVPWFRGNITLNNPLTDTQETKNSDD